MFNLNDLTIQTFDDSKQGRGYLTKIFPYDLTQVEEFNSRGAGIFFCPNPQEDSTRRSIDNTKALKCISLDLDICKERDKLSRLDADRRKQNLFVSLKNLEIPPNYVITTKNGLQPIWELSTPLVLDSIEERRKANDFYQRIIAGFALKTGLKSEGDNICRVIRLPNTRHLKNPKDPFDIQINSLDQNKVLIQEFTKVYPPVEKHLKTSIEKVVEGSEEGSRNVDAATLIGALIAQVRQKDWELMCWPLVRAWNNSCVRPPLEERELRATFESIKRSEQSKEGTSEAIFNIPTALEFQAEDFGGIRWLIEDLIPLAGTAIIVAKRASYKTWLSLYISYCVSKGLLLWDKISTSKSKVLYISNDDPSPSFQTRLSIFDFNEDVYFYHRNLPDFSIDQKNGSFPSVKSLIKSQGIGLVIVDILRNTHNKDSNSDKEAKEVFDKYKTLRIDNPNLVIIFIIHPSKEQSIEKRFGKRQTEEAVGSYYWEASVDTVISLTKTSEDDGTEQVAISVTKNKQSDKTIKPFVGVTRKSGGSVEFIYEEKIPDKLKIEQAKEYILGLLSQKNYLRQELIDLAVDAGICGERLVDQALRELNKEELVIHTTSKPHIYSLAKENSEDFASRNDIYDLQNAGTVLTHSELLFREEADEH